MAIIDCAKNVSTESPVETELKPPARGRCGRPPRPAGRALVLAACLAVTTAASGPLVAQDSSPAPAGGPATAQASSAPAGPGTQPATASATNPATLDYSELLQRRAALESSRAKLNEQLRQASDAVARLPELAAAKAQMDQARKILDANVAADPNVVEARKIRDAAEKAIADTLAAELAANEDIAGLHKEIAAAEDQADDIDFQIRLAKFILVEVRRRVEKDPAIVKMKQALADAEKQFLNHPKLQEARKAVAAAQQALDEREKGTPKPPALYDALQKAQRAYDALQKSPELADARKPQEQAEKDLEDAIAARIAVHPMGAPQIKILDADQAALQDLHQTIQEKQGWLRNMQASIEKDNPRVAAARTAKDDAYKLYNQVLEHQAAAQHSGLDKLQQDYSKLLDSKVAADPAVLQIRKQLDEINAKFSDLNRQINAAEKFRRAHSSPASQP